MAGTYSYLSVLMNYHDQKYKPASSTYNTKGFMAKRVVSMISGSEEPPPTIIFPSLSISIELKVV